VPFETQGESLVKRRSKRSAADATDAVATGLRSQEHGDLRAAEEAYRRADERGDPSGAFNLGRLLVERGELAAAAVAFRRADKRGEPAAATNLGVLLEQQADLAGAAAAYRRASERGHAAAAVNLGRLLARHHDVVGAEAAYRRAGALGDDGALELLAGLLAERDEPAVAEAAERAAYGEYGEVPTLPPAPARPPREATATDARWTQSAAGRSRFANPWNLRRRRSGAPEQATATSSPEKPAEPVVTAIGRPEKLGTDPRAKQPAAPEAPVAPPANERPDQPTATPTPEPANTTVMAGSTPEPPTSAPDEPTPTPPEVPAPPADEPAPLNDPPAEPQRRTEQVKALQAQLRVLGFDPGPADGRYGPLTTDAVTRFQEAHDLPVDGVLDPFTAEALRVILQPSTGERAERVTALQQQLSWLGLEPGPVDGRYGPLTTGAVTRFQQAHGLAVDGVVGPLTADVLAASAPGRAASAPERASSARIERVKALQRQLGVLGLDPGPVDGRYGPLTTTAVKRFQQAHDLHADGIADPRTQRAVHRSLLQQPQD
jgi:peptidoglycan hydrolase-like protein with peptidoglycan-binding domain/tetratricopeptide (TPR) repeat protein